MRARLPIWQLQLRVAVIAVIISIFLMTALHNAQLKAMTERHNAQLKAMTERHNAQLVAQAEECNARLAEQAARYDAQLVERSAETREVRSRGPAEVPKPASGR
jgi:sensor histidine kinase regulating citrate/malate metabolism